MVRAGVGEYINSDEQIQLYFHFLFCGLVRYSEALRGKIPEYTKTFIFLDALTANLGSAQPREHAPIKVVPPLPQSTTFEAMTKAESDTKNTAAVEEDDEPDEW